MLVDMSQPAGIRPLTRILVGCAALAVGAGTQAGTVGWIPNASLGPQLTVYVSQALWSRDTSARTYGIRLEQVRAEMDPARRGQYGTVRHKALIDLQFRRHAGPRLEFAARVTWDLERESLGPTPDDSIRVIDLAFRVSDFPAALLSGRRAAPTSRAALPARFALQCRAAPTDVAASYVRHRTDLATGACDSFWH
jgi:hypothetical protein